MKIDIREADNSAISPAHYKQGELEVVDIWRAKLTPEEFKGACKANVLKYLFRADYKGQVVDYEKAAVYLSWLIEAEKQAEQKKD